MNQWLIFYIIAVLDFLNMINASGHNFGTYKIRKITKNWYAKKHVVEHCSCTFLSAHGLTSSDGRKSHPYDTKKRRNT